MINTGKFSLSKPSILIVWLLIVLLGVMKFSMPQKNILSYDYFGLYLYLPATFIYHDPAISDISWLEQINATYHNTPMFYQLQKSGDYNLIRFFSGMAMLLSPFFFLGHLIALVGSYPADGFSFPYQFAMAIAAFFYVSVGLWYARKILLHFFDEKTTVFTLLALYLGTNLFFWTTFDAGAPHTILFTLYSVLLWYTIRWHKKPQKRTAMLIGLALGLIIVSRPSEIIAVCIPLFWNISGKESFLTKIGLIWENRVHFVLLIATVILMGIPQMLYYYHYTGKIFITTYTDPQSTLDFSNPRFAWVLFSFRKGWFVYAPLMVFSIAGLWWMVRKQIRLALPFLTFLLLNLLIIASFTSLISYGYRAFLQSYAILMIPLGFFIQFVLERKLWVKVLSIILFVFFVYFSVIQFLQIINGTINSSRMTKEYYKAVFLKTQIPAGANDLLLIDRSLTPEQILKSGRKFSSRMLGQLTFEENGILPDSSILPDYQGKVAELNPKKPFSPPFDIIYNQLSVSEFGILKIRAKVFITKPANENPLTFTATFTHLGIAYQYYGHTYTKDELKVNQWNEVEMYYLTPEVLSNDDPFRTTFWLRGTHSVYIENVSVELLVPEVK